MAVLLNANGDNSMEPDGINRYNQPFFDNTALHRGGAANQADSGYSGFSGESINDGVSSESSTGVSEAENDSLDDGHSSTNEWAMTSDCEDHIVEAAEKILRQTQRNSIDLWVLYRRRLRYRRLGLLVRAVSCTLAIQMREHEKEVLRTKIPDVRFNINAVSEKDCIDRFRFNKFQLAYLLMSFRIPAFFQLTKGIECAPLLRGDWDRVSTRLEDFASVIRAKCSELSNLWGFVDGTVRKICRPGNGTEQRAMYNGHKRSHAVKYQSVVTPELIVQLFGPAEGRAHDLTLLDESKLDEIISQDRRFRVYLLYGDPAYGQTNVVASPFDKIGATNEELAVNKSLSSVRITVEWGFGQIIGEWAMMDFKRKLTIGKVPVGMPYEVSAIFANCVTIARHQNIISSYFDVHPLTFAGYFACLE